MTYRVPHGIVTHVSKQVKKLRLKDTKEKQVAFRNSMSKVSIVVSAVTTAAEMEQEIRRSKVALQEMQQRLENFKRRAGRMEETVQGP